MTTVQLAIQHVEEVNSSTLKNILATGHLDKQSSASIWSIIRHEEWKHHLLHNKLDPSRFGQRLRSSTMSFSRSALVLVWLHILADSGRMMMRMSFHPKAFGANSSSSSRTQPACTAGSRALARTDSSIYKYECASILPSFVLNRVQHATQQLFTRAVNQVKLGTAPSDEVALDVSSRLSLMQSSVRLTTQTLTVFLGGVLAKRYTNPSADIITVLAGLDEVDAVFSDFANAVENIIRTGRSRKYPN